MANTTTQKTQVAVIGAGPGGYAAAFQAAALGLEVTLIDARAKLGGVCLNCGCIPSKALLHSARLLNEAREASEWGIHFAEPKIDLDRLRAWKAGVVDKLSGGIAQLAGARKVTVIHAWAKFRDSATLDLSPAADGPADIPSTLSFEHAIVATGSAPAVPAIFRLDDPRVMDSTGALELTDLPGRLLVVGGGYIGLELGSVYSALGSRVTVVELTDGLLPGADRDLVRPLEQRLKKSFESIQLGTKVEALKATKKGIVATLSSAAGAREETFDRVLVSIGRRPVTDGLGLENTKVKLTQRGHILVDPARRTDDPAIYAIGDVAGEPMLAHKASREAKVAAEAIAGHRAAFDSAAIPAVVFTDPEIAWCGLTEGQAKAQGREVKVVKFPWGASGRAATLGRQEGMTKLLIDPATERVLGVGMVGVGVGDLIAEGALAVEMGVVARDLADTIHPHPTLSETMMEAAEAFFGEATHLARMKG